MKFRNISKLGDLDVVGVGLVPYGETFEAVGDDAEPFLAQPDNYVHMIQHADGTESEAPRSSTETDLTPTDPPAGDPVVLTKES